MTNNVTLPGTGEPVATDEISGAHHQRIKITDGLEDSTLPMRVKATNADEGDAGAVVRLTPQTTWSVSFTNVNAAALDTPEMTLRTSGTGVTVAQAGGNLTVGAGTTARAEFLARSVRSFNGALIQRHQTVLSQRIANNNFAVLLADRIGEGLSCTINSATNISVTLTAHGFTAVNIGQSMNIGAIVGAAGVPGRYAIASIPDANTINFTVAGWPASGSCTLDLFGHNYSQWLYTGTTATIASFDAQRNGWNSGVTSPTVLTTASPGHMAQTAIDGRNIYYSNTLVASSAAPSITVLGHRVVNVPDSDKELFLYLWSYNGTTNPASNTTWTVGFVSVEDTVNLPVYLAGIRQLGFAAPMPVVLTVAGPTQPVSGTVTATVTGATIAAGTAAIGDVGVQYRGSATGAATPVNLSCPATPAAQVVKGAAGRLIKVYGVNSNAAARFLKVFNTAAGSVVMGTTSAVLDIPLPPNNVPVDISMGEGGIAFATAISVAITGSRGATDNTAITLNDVTGFLSYA